MLSDLANIDTNVFILNAAPFVTTTIIATLTIDFTFATIMVPAQTLLQRETPHAMIGHISSTNISIAFLEQIIELLLSDMFAEFFDIRTIFLLCTNLAFTLAAGDHAFLHAKQ